MLRKIWCNRLEFHPYMAILCFWFFGSLLQSFLVVRRPAVLAIGLVTILPVGLITLAVIKTYRILPETGTLSGPTREKGPPSR